MVKGEVKIKRYIVVVFVVCFVLQIGVFSYTMFGDGGCCGFARNCLTEASTRLDSIKTECREAQQHAREDYESAEKWRGLTMKCLSRCSEWKSQIDIDDVAERLRVHDGRRREKVK